MSSSSPRSEKPNSPDSADGAIPTASRRSTRDSAFQKTVTSLCLILGTLGVILSSGRSTDVALIPSSEFTHDYVAALQDHLDRLIPSWRIFQSVEVIVDWSISVLAIIAGTGLIHRRRWARWGAAAYALLSITFQLAFATYRITQFMPACDAFDDSLFRTHEVVPPIVSFSSEHRVMTVIWASAWVLLAVIICIAVWLPGASASVMSWVLGTHDKKNAV
jgi:hypothetical protein